MIYLFVENFFFKLAKREKRRRQKGEKRGQKRARTKEEKRGKRGKQKQEIECQRWEEQGSELNNQ